MADTSSTPTNTDITPTSGLDLNEEVSKLAELFPQFVKDGEVDFDAFKAWFSENGQLADTDEKYGLGWAGKSDAIQAIRRRATGTLKPDKEQSKDWDTTSNLFIEGDNLEVLKLLMRQYANKVKMIYIDPPYNTGKDFVYKDNFHEGVSDYYQRTGQDKDGANYSTNSSTSGRYHSDWLNMMYPRLFYAKQMLKDDGVIFISISDHEVHNLRLALDEIFGEENFEGSIHWRRRHNQPNDPTKLVGLVAEHILVYAKNSTELKKAGVGKLPLTGKFTNPDNDPRGKWNSKPWKVGSGQSGSSYKITTPSGEVVDEYWMGEEATYKKLLADNRIVFPNNGEGSPRKKIFEFERLEEGQSASNWFPHELFGSNQEASSELASLFDGTKQVFDNPKPTKLLKNLIMLGKVRTDDIVMDFFAGSSTTADALFQYNLENDISASIIMVQLPEVLEPTKKETRKAYDFCVKNNLEPNLACLSAERIRRAGAKLAAENKEILRKRKLRYDTGMKYFELQMSNYRRWIPIDSEAEDAPQLMLDQAKQSIDHPLVDDYTELDVVYEVALKEGANLNAAVDEVTHKNHKIYTVADTDRKIVVTFADKLGSDFAEGLGLGVDDLLVCLDSSLSDADKANLLQNIKLKTI